MSTREGRSQARRARIARQFLQVHDRVSEITRRRLVPFWQMLIRDVLEQLSRAHSPAIHVDQIFSADRWRPTFNAAILPGLKTTIYTGVAFEGEWIQSATGEASQQSVTRMLTQQIRADSESGNFGQKLHSIQQGNFSLDFPRDFFRDGFDGGSAGVFDSSRSGRPVATPSLWLTVQRGGSIPDDIPSIDVALTAELQQSVEVFLKSRSVGIWNKVSATTRKALQTTIRRGLTEGDSLSDLTKRIQAELTHYSKYEARRVARTETTAAMNFGQQAERDELGIEYKEWVSTIDNRTRGQQPKAQFDHLEPAGQTVVNGKPFIVSGEQLMFPGDISLGASGGNVIHCRCAGVGAWPEGTLTGGSGKARPKFTTPPKMSADDATSYAVSRLIEQEQNSPLTKQRIKQVVGLLKKHEEKLEKARLKTLEVPDKINTAHTVVKKLDEQIIRDEYRLNLAKAMGATKEEMAAIRKDGRKTIKALQSAKKKYERLTIGYEESLIKSVQSGSRPNVELVFDAGVSPEMRAKAEKAAGYIKGITSYESTGHLQYNVKVTTELRSHYDNDTRTLFMNPDAKIPTYVHEMAHGVEHQGNYFAESKGFLHFRTQHNVPAILKKRFPGSKFEPYEASLEDEFFRAWPHTDKLRDRRGAYVGKYYTKNTEVMSMGVELLYADPVGFARRDPEFFRFVIGVLQGRIRI